MRIGGILRVGLTSRRQVSGKKMNMTQQDPANAEIKYRQDLQPKD